MSLNLVKNNSNSPFRLQRSMVDQGGEGGAYESGGYTGKSEYTDGGMSDAIASFGKVVGAGLSSRTAEDKNKSDVKKEARLKTRAIKTESKKQNALEVGDISKSERMQKRGTRVEKKLKQTTADIKKYNESENKLVGLHSDLLLAQNRTQISETKLYNLQKKNNKPIYIENIKDCNDTIQKVYELSVLKDSACNVVISDKNVEIAKQDTIIKFQTEQKKNLLVAIEIKNGENQILNNINDNNKKQIRKEKLKKNFWKATAIGVGTYALKLIIFK